MSRRSLLCEGSEDRAALREILRLHGFVKKSSGPIRKQETLSRGELVVTLIEGEGKDSVVRDPIELLEQFGSPSDPIERLGLSFDPNGDDEPKWRAKLEKRIRGATREQTGYRLPRNDLPDVFIDPVPWTWTPSTAYGLPHSECLERIIVDLFAIVEPEHHQRIARWMQELKDPTWKTAARLWNAVVLPKVSGAGFYSQVFGQHEPTRKLFTERIESTPVGAALNRFLA